MKSELNSVLNDNVLDRSKLGAFADYIMKILKMMILSLIGLKRLWEKEKMLVTGIVLFSLNVFKKPFTQGR